MNEGMGPGMDELALVAGFRGEVPLAAISPQAEQEVFAAIRGRGTATHGHRPRLRLAVTGTLSVTLTGVLIAAFTLTRGTTARVTHMPQSGAQPPTVVTASAMAFARQAADAAKGPAAYPPGQWFYVRARLSFVRGNSVVRSSTQDFWRTAGPAPELRGPGITSQHEGTGWAFRNVIGQEASLRHGHRVASPFWQIGASGPGQGVISYRELTAMPTDPHALIAYLAARDHGNPGFEINGAIISGVGTDRPHRVFASILEIFDQYVPTARQAATLYQALSDLPGVTLNRHATDSAGRRGAAFQIAMPGPSPMTWQLIVNPRTYQMMGITVLYLNQRIGQAYLTQLPVSGPWVRRSGGRRLP